MKWQGGFLEMARGVIERLPNGSSGGDEGPQEFATIFERAANFVSFDFFDFKSKKSGLRKGSTFSKSKAKSCASSKATCRQGVGMFQSVRLASCSGQNVAPTNFVVTSTLVTPSLRVRMHLARTLAERLSQSLCPRVDSDPPCWPSCYFRAVSKLSDPALARLSVEWAGGFPNGLRTLGRQFPGMVCHDCHDCHA